MQTEIELGGVIVLCFRHRGCLLPCLLLYFIFTSEWPPRWGAYLPMTDSESLMTVWWKYDQHIFILESQDTSVICRLKCFWSTGQFIILLGGNTTERIFSKDSNDVVLHNTKVIIFITSTWLKNFKWLMVSAINFL